MSPRLLHLLNLHCFRPMERLHFLRSFHQRTRLPFCLLLWGIHNLLHDPLLPSPSFYLLPHSLLLQISHKMSCDSSFIFPICWGYYNGTLPRDGKGILGLSLFLLQYAHCSPCFVLCSVDGKTDRSLLIQGYLLKKRLSGAHRVPNHNRDRLPSSSSFGRAQLPPPHAQDQPLHRTHLFLRLLCCLEFLLAHFCGLCRDSLLQPIRSHELYIS